MQIDNGDVVSDITCICEYLDDLQGGSSLIGMTPEERAETRMWVRRIDLGIAENLANGFRYAEGEPRIMESNFVTGLKTLPVHVTAQWG